MTGVLPAAPAWFRHRVDGEVRLGVVDPGRREAPFVDCGAHDELALLAAAGLHPTHLLELAGQGRPMSNPPAFEVPVARPSKILCLGKNYAAHAAEFGAEVPKEPIFFCKLPDSLLAHGAAVVLPHWIETRIDHEIELAVVIGFADPNATGRKYVAVEDALELVAGYTILNDVTARRMQGDDRGQQRPWLRCKSFDSFCPVGPWVVPAASLPNAGDLAIELTVNDEPRQASRTSLMVVDVAHAIAYLSRHTTLRPGDLIATGTPAGVGPLRHADRVTGTIEDIGQLTNPVRREADPA